MIRRGTSLVRRFVGGLIRTVVFLVLLVGGLVAALGFYFSGPHYEGPASDHFDGKTFRNLRPAEHEGFLSFLKWQTHRDRGPWAERPTPFGPPPPKQVPRGQMRVTFVNHATMLLQMDGFNILTDPVWSERVSPVSFVGPRRQHQPGVRFQDLPHIDAVVLSHNHYDHFDLETLRRLNDRDHPRVFTGLGNGGLLIDLGLGGAIEMDWWKEIQLAEGVDLIAVPSQHFSGRGLFDRDRTLWVGYVVRGPSGLAYFAGDTATGPHFAEIRKRLGAPRLAMLPIGAYRPEWFMSSVHVSPVEAIAAQETLGAATAVAMHFGTFALGDDGQDEPAKALTAALAARGDTRPRFWVLAPGEGKDLPEAPAAAAPQPAR